MGQKLLDYDFEIQCQSGLENKVADALSRLPRTADLSIMTIRKVLDLDDLQARIGVLRGWLVFGKHYLNIPCLLKIGQWLMGVSCTNKGWFCLGVQS